MTAEEIFACWAPQSCQESADEPLWSRWAKPVAFAHLPQLPASGAGPEPPAPAEEFAVPALAAQRAIIVDLPGRRSVDMGVALARRGYRPVPLYNACHGASEVVDMEGLMRALIEAAEVLRTLQIDSAAPPAFLLDSHRLKGTVSPAMPGDFDNRWITLPQDFPSAAFLLSRGITEALLIQEDLDRPQNDLAHVLLRWQEAGMQILVIGPHAPGEPRPIVVAPPSRFRSLWYTALALVGLRRNSAGGFGSRIPAPSSGGYGAFG
jgi:hypothetical protein